MNTHDIEHLLLLESSGELTEADARRLNTARADDPRLDEKRRELHALEQAGRHATNALAPPLPDTSREAILRHAESTRRRGPGPLLAAAALVMIGLALWPHLPRPGADPSPLPVASVDMPDENSAPPPVDDDPLLEELNQLDREVRDLATSDPDDFLEPDHADYWALQLLAMEDSI